MNISAKSGVLTYLARLALITLLSGPTEDLPVWVWRQKSYYPSPTTTHQPAWKWAILL